MATKKALAPLANVPFMSGRLIWSFRHLECQNLSFISDSIDGRRGGKKSGTAEWENTIGSIKVLITLSVLITNAYCTFYFNSNL